VGSGRTALGDVLSRARCPPTPAQHGGVSMISKKDYLFPSAASSSQACAPFRRHQGRGAPHHHAQPPGLYRGREPARARCCR
jgi:hypothetical protein